MATAKQAIQEPARMPEKLFALAFKRGSNTRYVMAFADEGAAYDAAEIAQASLEVASVDGEYTVDEVPVRWGRQGGAA